MDPNHYIYFASVDLLACCSISSFVVARGYMHIAHIHRGPKSIINLSLGQHLKFIATTKIGSRTSYPPPKVDQFIIIYFKLWLLDTFESIACKRVLWIHEPSRGIRTHTNSTHNGSGWKTHWSEEDFIAFCIFFTRKSYRLVYTIVAFVIRDQTKHFNCEFRRRGEEMRADSHSLAQQLIAYKL